MTLINAPERSSPSRKVVIYAEKRKTWKEWEVQHREYWIAVSNQKTEEQ